MHPRSFDCELLIHLCLSDAHLLSQDRQSRASSEWLCCWWKHVCETAATAFGGGYIYSFWGAVIVIVHCFFLQWYRHAHAKDMPIRSIARLIQTMLYARRFFPYYVYNILGGIEDDGTLFNLIMFVISIVVLIFWVSSRYRCCLLIWSSGILWTRNMSCCWCRASPRTTFLGQSGQCYHGPKSR